MNVYAPENFVEPMATKLREIIGTETFASKEEAQDGIDNIHAHIGYFCDLYGRELQDHIHVSKPIYFARDDYVVEVFFSDELSELFLLNRAGYGFNTVKMQIDISATIQYWYKVTSDASPINQIWNNATRISAPELCDLRDNLLRVRADRWVEYAERATSPIARVFTHGDLATLPEDHREKIEDCRPRAFLKYLETVTDPSDIIFAHINEMANQQPQQYMIVAKAALVKKMTIKPPAK